MLARINRRNSGWGGSLMRSFSDELRAIEDHRLPIYRESGRRSRVWTAADIEYHYEGRYLTGTLGVEAIEERRKFDETQQSWISEMERGVGSEVVPFAIHINDS